MNANPHNRLRSPDECVGTLSHTDLPPPGGDPAQELGLLSALRQRDEAAFASLFASYHASMLRIAARYVRSDATAEEVVQDTWLSVLLGLDRFEGRSSLRTWIFRILVNRARSRARRDARLLPFSALSEGKGRLGPNVTAEEALAEDGDESRGWGGESNQRSPSEDVDVEELLARIDEAIRTLPERQRDVIRLRDLEGWSSEQVCALHGMSPANQRVLLHRARVKVRAALEGYLTMEPEPVPIPRAVA